MRRPTAVALPLAIALFVAGIPLSPSVGEADALVPGLFSPASITLTQVASGLSRPLLVTHAGDGSDRVFIVEQGGVVRVMQGGALDPVAYLNVASKVSCCGERGLLGMAFHPDFASNGKLFISYTRSGDGASVLEKLTVADPANGRPPANGEVLLVQSQPYSNHNGGMIAFGPDGYLWFGLGDGGSGGDPQNFAQNKNSLLGKMLRLDVDVASGYAIPSDNPYVNGGGRAEIWSIGLRNPWRFSFDRMNGDLWIGDVGQNLYEEIDYEPTGTLGGRNYGWRGWEGFHTYSQTEGLQLLLNDPRLTFPLLEYDHAQGCSVTGGYVYRGPSIPNLDGIYVYGDYCSGTIWGAYGVPLPVTLPFVPVNTIVPTPLIGSGLRISSFGEDEAGNLYVVNLNGSVHKIVPA